MVIGFKRKKKSKFSNIHFIIVVVIHQIIDGQPVTMERETALKYLEKNK